MTLTIALLILVGIILIMVEIFLTPGIGFAGIGGMVSLVVAMVYSFITYGLVIGSFVLLLTGAGIVVTIIYGFRNKTWERLALKNVNESRVNDDNLPVVQLGETGKAASNLRPYGLGEFFGKTYEVRTYGQYVDRGSRIKVIKLDKHTIFVEPVNEKL